MLRSSKGYATSADSSSRFFYKCKVYLTTNLKTFLSIILDRRIMSEVKKYPKCGAEMLDGKGLALHGSIWSVSLSKWSDEFGEDRIVPYYCKNCGYIELYKEMKEKRR